jgi:hypothetical protein
MLFRLVTLVLILVAVDRSAEYTLRLPTGCPDDSGTNNF